MLKGFKEFIMRGNVIDLAVAVIIGAAFTGIVNSLVNDIINPLLAAIIGKPDFTDLSFTLRGSQIMYGSFLTAVINFLMVAGAVYFLIVKPINLAKELAARGEAPASPTTRACPQCLAEVPIAATRCQACTQELPPVAARGSAD